MRGEKDAAGVLVAPRAPRVGKPGGCRVCYFEPDLVTAINEAIWPEGKDGGRARDYRSAAMRIAAQRGVKVSTRPITTHADHIEATWRRADGVNPSTPRERPVFPTDFKSVTERVAGIGMLAAEQLESEIENGEVDARDLIQAVRLGMGAVVEQRKAEDRSKNPQGIAIALFGLVSGHLDTPEGEVKVVTPVADLIADVARERAALTAGAGYAPEDDDLASVLA